MTVDDYVKIFEEIGSRRTTNAKEIGKVINEELERYGIVDDLEEI